MDEDTEKSEEEGPIEKREEPKTKTEAEILDPSGKSEQSRKRAKEINGAVSKVSAQELASELFKEMPGISEGANFETANPLPIGYVGIYNSSSNGNNNNSPAADRFEHPRDARRLKFNPRKHISRSDGSPDTSKSNYWRNIPASWSKDEIKENAERFEQWVKRQKTNISPSGDAQDIPVSEDDLKNEAGEWLNFIESLGRLIFGEKAEFQKEDGRIGEREAFERGLVSAFKRWRVVKFPALLGISIAGGVYFSRVFKPEKGWNLFKKKAQSKEARFDEMKEAENVQVVEVEPREKTKSFVGEL